MFARNRGAATTVVARVGSAYRFVNPLITDPRIRKRIVAARKNAKRQTALIGFAADPILRTRVAQVAKQLPVVQFRAKKQSHKMRNLTLFAVGVGVVALAVPSIRHAIADRISSNGDDWAPDDWSPNGDAPIARSTDDRIESDIPIPTPAAETHQP